VPPGQPRQLTLLTAHNRLGQRIEAFAARALAGLDRLDFNGRQQLLRLVLEDVRVQGWQVDLRLRIPLDETPPDDTAIPALPRRTCTLDRSPRGPARQRRECQARTVCVPSVNICEHCPNFRNDPAFLPILAAQRADAETLAADAAARGWDGEAARHRKLAERLDLLITRTQAS